MREMAAQVTTKAPAPRMAKRTMRAWDRGAIGLGGRVCEGVVGRRRLLWLWLCGGEAGRFGVFGVVGTRWSVGRVS